MDAATFSNVARWFHVGAGGAWFGEVLVVVFILVPIVRRATPDRRSWFLATVFTRVFRLASVLSATAVVTGGLLWLSTNDWHLNLDRLVSERWGLSILVGGALGLGLTLFHFVAERKLEPMAVRAGSGGIDDEVLVRRLTIIPRVGLGILVVILGSMMYAARGF